MHAEYVSSDNNGSCTLHESRRSVVMSFHTIATVRRARRWAPDAVACQCQARIRSLSCAQSSSRPVVRLHRRRARAGRRGAATARAPRSPWERTKPSKRPSTTTAKSFESEVPSCTCCGRFPGAERRARTSHSRRNSPATRAGLPLVLRSRAACMALT